MDSTKDTIFNNALNCLIYNEKLNKLISETVKNIDRTIDSLKDSQEYMLSQIKSEDEVKGSYVSQIINGQNMCRVRKPFFTSNNGLMPYTNNIEKRRIEDSSHDYYLLKHQTWKLCNENEFESLKIAVGKNVYDIEHAKILRSKDKNSLKKLKALKLSSWLELSEKCGSDMIDRIDWMTIASQDLKGKISHTDCQRLWEKVFNPDYVYTKWSESESNALLELTSELGCQGKWIEIASRMPTKRQPFICYKRWLELTSRLETSEEWGTEEDEHLGEIIDQIKEIKTNKSKSINWNKVALLVPNRSARDCERRWNSLQVPVNSRQFSDSDDYQLLLLIKKMGTDNWADIGREMHQRTSEQCQKRYCDIVDELHPWSYFEDRRLWLVLRSYFRPLWVEGTHVVDATANLTIYNSVIKGFNGRCPIILRDRYSRLCKWFYLWNKFYLSLNMTESKNPESVSKTALLLSDSCEEKAFVINKILKIILRTSFFDRIRNALLAIGSCDPDGETHELITMCKNGNSVLLNSLIKESPNQKLMDLLMFVIDLQNGIFIPTKFEDYINRSYLGLKYPDKAKNNLRVLSTNVRAFESKTAISITLRKSLCLLLNDEKITPSDKDCITKLIECEGKFNSALNYATLTLEKTHQFKFVAKVDLLEKFLPQFLRLMIQYVYCQEKSQISAKDITLCSNIMFANKREQIAELLMYRGNIAQIFKTYVSADKRCGSIGTMYLPKSVVHKLSKEDRLAQCKKNSLTLLKSQQKYPSEDNVVFSILNNDKCAINEIPLLPPNRCSLNFLRAFILQKQTLKATGEQAFTEMTRLRYDNPTKYLQPESITETSLTVDKSSLLLCDPRYMLLRSRILSILALPSVIARISPLSCARVADRLHETQNDVTDSVEISNAFNIINVPQSDSKLEFDLQLNNKYCASRYSTRSRKRSVLQSFETDVIPLLWEQPKIVKINHDQPLTRSIGNRWIKLFAPECSRAFFVSKHLFQSFIKNNFVIESINGIQSEEFLT